MGDGLSEVKVGDRLVVSGRSADHLAVVDRLTAKWVITRKGAKYRRDTGRQVGGGEWDRSYATPASEDDVQRIHAKRRRERAYNELRALVNTAEQRKQLDRVPVDQLEQALALLRPNDG